jgi:hypothetical protein
LTRVPARKCPAIKVERGIQQLWCGEEKKNRKYSSSIALYTYLLLKRKVLLPLSFISFPTSSLERGRFFNKHKK